ncbi:TRAP transporter small permease [Pseudobacillus sp. FSL P4-0506]|uniref:TRAP transporter small permease n=1 Tax=unclassified Pseudobacillus TaxID=2619284 RepID=UPI0030F51B8B
MRGFFPKLSFRIDQASRVIIIFLFSAAFIGTVYQVVSRFILQSSIIKEALPMIDFSVFNLTWIEELIRYLFVWVVFLGIGTVYKNKGHARVEVFINRLPEKWKMGMAGFIEVINSALFVFLIIYGLRILKFTSQQISPSLGLNMIWIYGAVVVSSVICLIHAIAHLSLLKTKEVESSGSSGRKAGTDIQL